MFIPLAKRGNAFSRSELLVTAGTIFLLGLLVFVGLVKTKEGRIANVCVQNIHQIGFAFMQWPQHGPAEPPWQSYSGTLLFTNSGIVTPHFLAASNLISDLRFLTCPGDTRIAATSWQNLTDTNISYFINLDSTEFKPDGIGIGDRGLISSTQPTNGMLIITTDTTYQWKTNIHNGRGTISYGNYSVHQFKSGELTSEFQKPINLGSRIQLPR